MIKFFHKTKSIKIILIPIILSVILIVISRYNFLLFHTLAEFFAIIVAVLACVIAWQMYSYTRNHFLMYLGCGYLWIASLDMMHTLTYKGISILTVTGSNTAIQIWIGTRYLEAILLLSAPWFLTKTLSPKVAVTFYGVIAMSLLALVMTENFPVGFIEGKGLTNFKIYSEYLIITILSSAIFYLFKRRNLLDNNILILMIISIVFTMVAELAFTFYINIYGISNIAGHLFKLVSFWLIFVAVVRTPLREPFNAVSKAETYYDAVPDATIIIDNDGTIHHVNKSAVTLANEPSSVLIGSSAHQFFHNKSLSELDCTVCQLISNGKLLTAYEQQIDKSKWFEYTTSILLGANRTIQVIRDISDKKLTSIALEKSNAQLNITLNSIGDAVIATDIDGNITRMNPVAEDITGWSFEESLGNSIETVFSIIDASSRNKIENPIEKVIRSGETIHLSNHTTLISKNGTEHQITDSAAPILNEKNEKVGMVLVFNDVTEEYLLRQEASKSRRDLQAIMDNSPEVIYVKDTEGKYLFINLKFETLFHIKRKDIIGKTDYDIFPKDMAEQFKLNDHAVLSAKHALDSEEIAPQDDGDHTYISSKFPMFDENGKIFAICGISTDITERKKIEARALKSSELNRTIIEKSPIGIAIYDDTGQCIVANDALIEIIGAPMEEVLTQNYKQLESWKKGGLCSTAEKALKELSNLRFELPIHTTFGNDVFIEGTMVPLPAGDKLNLLLLANNVAERKKMELTLKETQSNLIRAQEIAKIGNWKLFPDIGKVSGSTELLKIFDLVDEELTLENFANAVHPDDREYDLMHIQNGIENGAPWDIEHRLQLKDGRIKWVHAIGEPILDKNGKTSHIIGIIQDITERRLSDEVVRRSQKMDALGKLTGGIAHDYNNMLGVINGYADLIKNLVLEQPKLLKYITEIAKAGERGAKLTKKLLAFSRDKNTDAENIDINKLLLNEQHMLEKTLTARITLIFNLCDSPWIVWLDSSDLEDAILNICINSMNAIEANGELLISTENKKFNLAEAQALQLQPGDYLLLSISDTGIGIDEQTREKIFDPFFSTKGDLGTGLGLSQVYGFVERSGGIVKVYSEVRKGTELLLYFPRSNKEAKNDAVNNTEDKNLENYNARETILLVDDELALLELTTEILELEGYKVISVDSAKKALEVLKTKIVNLMLSDVIMPEMNGYQLSAVVQKKYPDIKILLTSGFTDKQHVDMIDKSLYDNLLVKPYHASNLFKKIRELMEKNN